MSILSLKELNIKNDMPRGWVCGKNQPKWHSTLYDRWRRMWSRCNSPEYPSYYGLPVDDRFRLFSFYVEVVSSLDYFTEFCNSPNLYHIDKDFKNGQLLGYTPDTLKIIYYKDNIDEMLNRCGNPFTGSKVKRVCNFNEKARINSGLSRRKPIIGIGKSIILLHSAKDGIKLGFNPSNITNCLKKRYATHKEYKWYYISYKHNKRYRKV